MNNIQMKINPQSELVQKVCSSSHCQKVLLKYKSEQVPDVLLISEDSLKRIPAHRSILSAASEYFSVMFSTNMAEKKQKEIVIKEVNADILEKLIDFCYTGEFLITSDNIWELLPAASMLAFSDMKNECAVFLESILFQSPSDCLFIYAYADLYDFKNLAIHSVSIAVNLFATITKTDAFLNIPFKMLKSVLEKRESIALQDEDILRAAIAWMNHEPERHHFIKEILNQFSLKDMSLSFLSSEVKNICFLHNCQEMLCDALVSKASHAKEVDSRNFLLFSISEGSLMMECFCTKTISLTSLKTLPLDSDSSQGKIVVLNKDLYIIGKTTIKINIKTSEKSSLADMNTKRSQFGVASLNGFIYVFGGIGYTTPSALNSAECYNPCTNMWTYVKNMSITRDNAGTAVWNNRIYVLGGCTNGQGTKTCEYYDPLVEKWIEIADMIQETNKPHVCVLNDMIYVIRDNGTSNISVQIYNPKLNNWNMVSTTTSYIGVSTVAVFENEIIKVTNYNRSYGYNNYGYSYRGGLEKLNLEQNMWTTIISPSISNNYSYAAPVLTKFL